MLWFVKYNILMRYDSKLLVFKDNGLSTIVSWDCVCVFFYVSGWSFNQASFFFPDTSIASCMPNYYCAKCTHTKRRRKIKRKQNPNSHLQQKTIRSSVLQTRFVSNKHEGFQSKVTGATPIPVLICIWHHQADSTLSSGGVRSNERHVLGKMFHLQCMIKTPTDTEKQDSQLEFHFIAATNFSLSFLFILWIFPLDMVQFF